MVIGKNKDKINEKTLPGADSILVVKNYTDIFFQVPVDEYCKIIVTTGEQEQDTFILGQALETRAKFIAIAGENNQKKEIITSLGAYGWAEKDFARIHWLNTAEKDIVKAMAE